MSTAIGVEADRKDVLRLIRQAQEAIVEAQAAAEITEAKFEGFQQTLNQAQSALEL